MGQRAGSWVGLVCGFLAIATPCASALARDYRGPPLSAEEREAALALFQGEECQKAAAKALEAFVAESPLQGMPILVDLHPRIGGGLLERSRLAVLRHVQYRDNGVFVTLRSVINLSAKRLGEVTAKAHEATPLAPEEIARCTRIVKSAHPQLAARFGEQEPTLTVLVAVVGQSTSPVYGHRLVDVRFGEPDPDKGPYRARIDLSKAPDSAIGEQIRFYPD